ncbi:hypothetical protein MNR02_08525 [Shinella sp. H4-D48]|uniref:hypothetical protein n=1 Tax=Shinella sp. H4-D48 TaxID=2925841 RepID=UPI001F536E03|nr:hypothetical protein [Shinella sp. H4-D48]UNK36558.1 hypothetical protein MNR02_08525 [Shinella sp. H4-D48]
MSDSPSNRDLSQLSALLAVASHTPAPTKSKKSKPVPANDNKAPDVLSWPTLERLAHRGDEVRVYALRHWKNLNYPGSGYIPPQPTDDETDEVQVETRPSEAELLRAVDWTVTGSERWEHTGRIVKTYERADLPTEVKRHRNGTVDIKLGDLVFRDGEMVEWGRTRKGRALRPVERARGVKGGEAPGRTEAAIWSYIRIRPGAPSPFAATSLRRPFSGTPVIVNMYDPLPREEPSTKDRHGRFGVEEARALLKEHGVDGSVAFADLPVPAAQCQDTLVPGPQWVGGVKKPKPLGEISQAAGRECELARRVETGDYVDHLRRLLGDHAKVLDLAISDATAREIGIVMGKAPAYAEKAGPWLIDAAIDALIAVDETARLAVMEEKKIAA